MKSFTPRRRLTCVPAILMASILCAASARAATLPHPVPREDFWVTDGPVLSLLEHDNVLYVGGNFANVGPNTVKAAILPGFSESPDTAWPKMQAVVYAAVPDGNGGWYVGGDTFDDDEPNPNGGNIRYLLTHLKADKTLDTGFNPLPTGQVYTLLKDGNTLYVGGNFGSIGGQVRRGLAAINLTTGQATSFDPAPDSYVYALAKSGNTLYVGGAFVNIGGQEQRGLAAVDATTGALQSFPALSFGGSAYALHASGSTLYVGGNFNSVGGTLRTNLAALSLPGGSALLGFNAGMEDPGHTVYALARSADTLYVGGYFNFMGGVATEALAALNPTTGQNLGLNLNPTHFGNANVVSLAVNGTDLYVGGRFSTLGGSDRNYLARLNTANNQLQSWNPRAAGGQFAGQVVWVLAHDGNNLFVGGDFATVGAQARNYLAAFNITTGEATAWNPNPGGGVFALAQHNNVIYAGGEFYNIGGAQRNLLAGIDLNGSVTSFTTDYQVAAHAGVNKLLVAGNNLYVGGGFTYALGHINLAKYDLTDGSLVSDWNPNPLGPVYDMGLDAGILYICGYFAQAGGQARNNLAAINTGNGLATTWDPNPNSFVLSLAVGASEVYASGAFNTLGGQSRNGIGAVSRSTGLATPWAPGNISYARSMELAGNHLLLGGDFHYYAGSERRVSYFGVADTDTADVLRLDLQLHPSIIFAIHRGARNYYVGGDQPGSRNVRRPYLSVHRLAPFLHTPQVQPGGQVNLLVDGLPNQSYKIEATADFQSWLNLGSFFHASGTITVNDSGAVGQPRRYYRATEETEE
jgi:trimeric autotransporter adhesin